MCERHQYQIIILIFGFLYLSFSAEKWKFYWFALFACNIFALIMPDAKQLQSNVESMLWTMLPQPCCQPKINNNFSSTNVDAYIHHYILHIQCVSVCVCVLLDVFVECICLRPECRDWVAYCIHWMVFIHIWRQILKISLQSQIKLNEAKFLEFS